MPETLRYVRFCEQRMRTALQESQEESKKQIQTLQLKYDTLRAEFDSLLSAFEQVLTSEGGEQ